MGSCAGKSRNEEPYSKRDVSRRSEVSYATRKVEAEESEEKQALFRCSVASHEHFIAGWRKCFLIGRVYPWDRVDLDASLDICFGSNENSMTTKPYLEDLHNYDVHSQLDENCELSFLIRCIEKVSLFDAGPVSKKITWDIQCIVNDIFNLAYDRYPAVFNDFRIHLVGSMSERTKLRFPTEHDFFVTLPGLLQKSICTFQTPAQNSLDIGLMLVKVIYFERHQIFQPYRHQYKLKNICEGSRTTTLHVKFDNGNIERIIDIDICLGVPASILERSDLSRPLHGAELSWVTAVTNQETQQTLHYFYDRTHEYLDTTSVFLESSYFRQYSANDNRLRCYRTAKFLTGLLFPTFRKTNTRRCHRLCRSPIIPSYYLKTAMFYLMLFYEDDEYWTDEVVGNRLIEVFITLRLAIERQHFTSLWLPFKELPFFGDIVAGDIVSWADPLFPKDCIEVKYNHPVDDANYVIHVQRMLDVFIDCLMEARSMTIEKGGENQSRLCNALFPDEHGT